MTGRTGPCLRVATDTVAAVKVATGSGSIG